MNDYTDLWPCKRCGELFDRSGKAGQSRSWCTACCKQYMLDYVANNPDKYYKPCPECGAQCGLSAAMCKACRQPASRPAPRKCAFCGKSFTPKQKATARHCSAYCRNTHKYRLDKDAEYGVQAECLWCFASFDFSTNRPCCSSACSTARDQHYLTWRQAFACPVPRCIDCDVVVPRMANGKRCATCQLTFDVRRRNFSEARRKRAERAGDMDIHWRMLGDRDQWVCHICGLRVPKRAGNAKDGKGATVDHIVPVAAGGSHTWDNVALAHRFCNLSRGARGVAQLRLIG